MKELVLISHCDQGQRAALASASKAVGYNVSVIARCSASSPPEGQAGS